MQKGVLVHAFILKQEYIFNDKQRSIKKREGGWGMVISDLWAIVEIEKEEGENREKM